MGGAFGGADQLKESLSNYRVMVKSFTDINQNSSVSLHGGFLKYELSQNALIDQTVLSFRTDQSQALILFVHDHNNNFMQVCRHIYIREFS